MTTFYRPRWVAGTLLLAALIALPVAAQSFRQPWYPGSYPVHARVTITNQTDIAVVFHAQWGDELARREVLDPGQATTLETTFRAGTPKPELTVTYRTGPWHRRPEVLSLPSGHVDPQTNNPGRVYDFYQQRSNVGPIVTLSAR